MLLETLDRLFLYYRLAVFAKSFAFVLAPAAAIAGAMILVGKSGLFSVPIEVALLLGATGVVAWLPIYFKMRKSVIEVARKVDEVLQAGGIITAGADIAKCGGARTSWGILVQEEGAKLLNGCKARRIVPRRNIVYLAPTLLSFLLLGLSLARPTPSVGGRDLNWNERQREDASLPLFSPLEEKLLRGMYEKLLGELGTSGPDPTDQRLRALKEEVRETVSPFPKGEEELTEYLTKVERLKKMLAQIEAEMTKEQLILQQAGKKMDGKLLEEIGKGLEEKKLEGAAEAAAKLAEKIEKGKTAERLMQEAALDLEEGVESAQKKLAEEAETEHDGSRGENGQKGEGMDEEAFDRLKSRLEKMAKLADLFGTSSDQIPKWLKDLAKDLLEMDLSQEQLNELKEMIEKLDSLKNMMVDAKEGGGKGSYSKLMKEFAAKASGGEEGAGQEGLQGGGEEGEASEGQEGQEGAVAEGRMGKMPSVSPKGGGGGSAPAAGVQPAGKGRPGGPEDSHEDLSGQQSSEESKSTGQEGWGSGTATPLGDLNAGEGGAKYKDEQVAGKESPGPLKKDVIKGAAKKGFVGKDYKRVYEEYSSIVWEIMEEENVPPLYRYYINRYFELISPR